MNKPISTDLPDECVRIADDLEAQAFLLALGILDQLPSASTLAYTGDEGVNTIFACHFTHATHWILACRFHGMADERENGFVVWAWPKSKWPRTTIEDAINRQNLGSPLKQTVFRIGDTPLS